MKPLASLWCSIILGGSPLAGFAHSAIESTPRDARWMERHNLINQRVTETGTQAQVIFIGDSITQGWEGAGREVWDRYYAHRHALNLGIGGDRTQHVLWRLDNGNLQGLQPKAAVVMIGTNNSNNEDNSVEQIADGVTAIVRKLRTALPQTQVVLISIFPRSENPTPQRGKVLMVNQIIRKLSTDPKVSWIDFGDRFLDEHGRIPASLMPDFLHLSPAGYRIWAEAIEDTLADLLGDSPVAISSDPTLTGSWTWTITGPDGEPVSAALKLDQRDATVTGEFQRDATRWLPLQQGQVSGNTFSWVVDRNRPDGTTLSYRMSGTFTRNSIEGKVTTILDGSSTSSTWSAQRD